MTETQTLVERLERLDTSVVSDVLDESGLPNQILSKELRPFSPGMKLAGPALCARGENYVRTQSEGGGRKLSPYEIERRMRPGAIAVIDAGSQHVGAAVGGFVARTLKSKGARGLVVNGGLRDVLEIEGLGLPFFFRFATPVNASRRWELVEVEQPISLPGIDGGLVLVHPGDLILGDFDGIAVIPLRFAEPIIEAAETLAAIENRINEEIAAGSTREEAFARHSRFKHIKRLV